MPGDDEGNHGGDANGRRRQEARPLSDVAPQGASSLGGNQQIQGPPYPTLVGPAPEPAATVPPAHRPRTVLLHGGGVESTACLAVLAKSGAPFEVWHFDYRHHNTIPERIAILSQIELFNQDRVIPIHFTEVKLGHRMLDNSTAEVRNRNLTFISLALAQADTVVVGLSSDSDYPDAGPEFLKRLRYLLAHTLPGAQVIAPFEHGNKGDCLMAIRALDRRLEEMIWTCSIGEQALQCWQFRQPQSSWCDHCVQLFEWRHAFDTKPLSQIKLVPVKD